VTRDELVERVAQWLWSEYVITVDECGRNRAPITWETESAPEKRQWLGPAEDLVDIIRPAVLEEAADLCAQMVKRHGGVGAVNCEYILRERARNQRAMAKEGG
jgi:hypothetical protein